MVNDISLSLPISPNKLSTTERSVSSADSFQKQRAMCVEFLNLKIISKFKNNFKQLYCSRQKVCCDITPAKLFFKNGGLLTYSSVSQILNFVSERASDPSPTRYGLQHPRKDCRGQVGDS
jgi:hypothetical protein